MIIRSANKRDLEDCEKLLRIEEFKWPEGNYPYKKYLERYIDKKYFLVAEEKRKVIGCIFGERLKGNLAILWYFAVDKNYRARGIGTKLLREFEKNCKRDGERWIILYTYFLSKKSLEFYKKRKYHLGNKFIEIEKGI